MKKLIPLLLAVYALSGTVGLDSLLRLRHPKDNRWLRQKTGPPWSPCQSTANSCPNCKWLHFQNQAPSPAWVLKSPFLRRASSPSPLGSWDHTPLGIFYPKIFANIPLTTRRFSSMIKTQLRYWRKTVMKNQRVGQTLFQHSLGDELLLVNHAYIIEDFLSIVNI